MLLLLIILKEHDYSNLFFLSDSVLHTVCICNFNWQADSQITLKTTQYI